ncbi:hypothetical protein CE91St49_13540 [Emergencia timonensis]|nr:hypothetical protein CE91St48_13590 [Emergencia timonensis]BDF12007.1 hypothetical protein CE91St49_13540 [Emergencia timonensis]
MTKNGFLIIIKVAIETKLDEVKYYGLTTGGDAQDDLPDLSQDANLYERENEGHGSQRSPDTFCHDYL